MPIPFTSVRTFSRCASTANLHHLIRQAHLGSRVGRDTNQWLAIAALHPQSANLAGRKFAAGRCTPSRRKLTPHRAAIDQQLCEA